MKTLTSHNYRNATAFAVGSGLGTGEGIVRPWAAGPVGSKDSQEALS
jgi:hypothetical protein